MNRLSWDTTAPRRPRHARRGENNDQQGFADETELLRPAWDELRRIHRM
jgi:hypothetical protein